MNSGQRLSTNDVLLYFRDFERDSFVRGDRYLKRILRPIYHRFKRGPKVSGFSVWYQLLAKALKQAGYNVHLNDYALARKNPTHPVGLVGYPHLLDVWSLPNPAVLGPALFDHPLQAPTLMQRPSHKFYLLTCQWMFDMFSPVYGDRCGLWYAGMDLRQWPIVDKLDRPTDVLIYDKVRWQRERYEPEMIQPIQRLLDQQGLRWRTIRYGRYDHQEYRTALEQSRSMIFLCEHETQGMAYQEALTSNVPVLAWDNGYWLDPQRPKFNAQPIPATSVPYFSPECGQKFHGIEDFPEKFEAFWKGRDTYRPRDYVERELSMQGSADAFMKYYRQAAEK